LTADLIQFAYVAGEIAPSFHGRSDLEKYDLALSEAENFFVDYRGGVSTRPGLEFIDYILEDDKPLKLISFKFSADIEDSYLVMIGHEYIRFVQDGAYVLEAGQSVTSISQTPIALLTKAGHGYANGDWVKVYNVAGMTEIEAQTFVVDSAAADTFRLYFPTGQPLVSTDLTAFTTGTMARVYTLVSPYDSADLEVLQTQQILDLIRFTHNDYEIHNLVRFDHADWELEPEDFSNPVTRVTEDLTISNTANGQWQVGYVVTAVDFQGNESYASPMTIEINTENPAVAPASFQFSWGYTENISHFNVYRSRFFYLPASYISYSAEVGYIGRSYGTHFQDNGIIPDFSITPPRDGNPFADGALQSATITDGGDDYDPLSVITIVDPTGTGFAGEVLVSYRTGISTDGPVAGIRIIERGSGYTAPVETITVGTDAIVDWVISPLTGNYPACCAIFQQRQLYAATLNFPLTVFGSRPGRLSNFNESELVTDGDPYTHTIDAESMAPIRHLVPSQGGCLILSQDGVWLLTGEGGVVTPINAQADPKAFSGSALLPPLKVESDLLYLEGKLNTVRMLSFNDVTQERFYSGKDVSVLANHMISSASPIQSWTYAADPFKQVYAAREDGVALTFTVLKEQEIYAWTRFKTQGHFEAVHAVQEGRHDRVYYIVRRYVNGRWTKFLERQTTRTYDHLESAMCVDCGLELGETTPAASLQLASAVGSGVIATASAAVFAAEDVGKVIRAGAGKATVVTFTDATHVIVDISPERPFEKIPETERPRLFASGDWSMDAGVSVLTGLWHLEGETVAILADANVVEGLTVVNGTVTLPFAVTRLSIGLGYTCRLKSLPFAGIIGKEVWDHRRRRVPGIALRFADSRGARVGSQSYDRLYPLKERSTEPYSEPTRAQTGMRYLSVEPSWSTDGQIFLEQRYPLPATVLGWIPQFEVGDDTD